MKRSRGVTVFAILFLISNFMSLLGTFVAPFVVNMYLPFATPEQQAQLKQWLQEAASPVGAAGFVIVLGG